MDSFEDNDDSNNEFDDDDYDGDDGDDDHDYDDDNVFAAAAAATDVATASITAVTSYFRVFRPFGDPCAGMCQPPERSRFFFQEVNIICLESEGHTTLRI